MEVENTDFGHQAIDLGLKNLKINKAGVPKMGLPAIFLF